MDAFLLTEGIGWVATGVFVASYFFTRPGALRTAQMCGAILWCAYGVLIGSLPVIVANVLVFSAAAWSVCRIRRAGHAAAVRLEEAGQEA